MTQFDFKSLGLSALGSGIDATGLSNLKIGNVNVGGQIQSAFINSIYTAFQEGTSTEDKLKAIGASFAGMTLQTAQQIVMDKVKSVLKSLVTNAAAVASSEVAEQTAEAGELQAEVQLTEADLQAEATAAQERVELQQNILSVASSDLTEINEQLTAEQEAIQETLRQIQELQSQLAATRDPSVQMNLLGQIQGLAGTLASSIAFVTSLNEDATAVSENVQEAYNAMVEESEGLQLTVQEGSDIIAELAEDAGAQATEVVATEAEGAVNTTTGATLTATGTAMASNIFTAAAAPKVLSKGADQTGAGALRASGSALSLAQIMQGLGGLAENTQLLATFQTSIGSALSSFVDGLGAWNTSMDTFITSFGSIASADVTGQVTALNAAVATDQAAVSSKIGNKKEETSNDEGNATSPIKAKPSSTLPIFNQAENELETPRVRVGFGL